MAVRVVADNAADMAKVHFVLPLAIHDGPVSVVGSFNDWMPGRHLLVRRRNGTRSVAVPVPTGQEVRYRYLGSGGRWFDDPDTPEAGVIRL
jgi:1,4-alpha-glucan branching enzyme